MVISTSKFIGNERVGARTSFPKTTTNCISQMPKYQYSHTYINTHSAEKVFLYYVELITWYENASTAGGITKLNYNWRNADLAKR